MTTSHGINIGEPENLVSREEMLEFEDNIEEWRRYFMGLWKNAGTKRNAYHVKSITEKLTEVKKEIQKVETEKLRR